VLPNAPGGLLEQPSSCGAGAHSVRSPDICDPSALNRASVMCLRSGQAW
jgi:hypothetical protein